MIGCGAVDLANLDPDLFSQSATGGVSCEGVNPSFQTDVIPIFSQQFGSASCASSSCHGATPPQGNLNLSVANEAEGVDGVYDNLNENSRISRSDPRNSKIVQKPLGLLDHGGGTIIPSVSDDAYVTLLCWVEAGAENN